MTPNESPAALLQNARDDILNMLPLLAVDGSRIGPVSRGIRERFSELADALASTAPVASESRGSVPDEFVLVPKKPTTAMVKAAAKSHEGRFYLPISLWESMLAAAPTPPAVASGEPTAEHWIDMSKQRPADGQRIVYLFEPFNSVHIGTFHKAEIGDPESCDMVAGKSGFTSVDPEVPWWIPVPPELARSAAAKGEGQEKPQ